MSELQHPPHGKRRKREVFYCGCLEKVGHATYSAPGKPLRHDDASTGMPWKYLDSSEHRVLAPKQQGGAQLTHLDGWTMLSIHDFTVDSRGGSHSTFATKGTFTVDEMLAFATESYPHVVARIGPVVAFGGVL